MLQQVQSVQKAGELLHGVPLVPVGVGKVGENPLRLQPRQSAQGVHLPGRLGRVVGQNAQPAHAGVQLDVDLGGFALGLGGLGEGLGQLWGKHRLGQVMLHHLGSKFRRGGPQNENRHGDARTPQLFGLVEAGHRQIVRHCHRPMSVGVGLHYTQKFALGGQGPQHVVIMLQIVQTDLRPGSHGLLIHCRSSPW